LTETVAEKICINLTATATASDYANNTANGCSFRQRVAEQWSRPIIIGHETLIVIRHLLNSWCRSISS